MSLKSNKNGKISIPFVIIGIAIIVALYYFLILNKKEEVTFTFKDSSIKVRIGELKQVEYVLSDDTIKVEWFSSNDSFTVDEYGIVKANQYGQAIITGRVKNGDNYISNNCYVSSYTGNEGVKLENIEMAGDYLLMKEDSEYNNPFTIVPSDAYIDSINYYSSNENVAVVDNNNIISKKEGKATISIVINGKTTKDLQVEVSNKAQDNSFIKKVNGVALSENELALNIGETREIAYKINPTDGYVENIKWVSSDDNILTVVDGKITAINSGTATVKIIINNSISDSVLVKVNGKEDTVTPTPKPTVTPTPTSVTKAISIDLNPKSVLKVGERTSIIAHINPENNKDSINFKSNNTNVVTVDQNGIVTGVSAGKTKVVLSCDGGKTVSFSITVLPSKGAIKGTANLWGYKSLNAKTPQLATTSFFQNLAKSGRGTLTGSMYYITTSEGQFSYNLNIRTLTFNNKNIRLRIYYPPDTDLSKVNTLTYLGGDGEWEFEEYFTKIANNPSIISNGGIVALVPKGNGTAFDPDAAVYVTKFLKVITNQQSYAKNSIMGFSAGGFQVIDAASKFNYDRIIVFSSYYPGTTLPQNVKNKPIVFIIPAADKVYAKAKNTLVSMRNAGYSDVTLITNSEELKNMFASKYLVINPGSAMQDGHLSVNVELSGVIPYSND